MLAPAGLVIAGLSLVLNVVGMAIPYWLYLSKLGVSLKIGLWQLCASNERLDQSACITYETVNSDLRATRGLEVMAVLALAAAVGCFFLKLFVMKQQHMLPKVGAAMAIVSGIFAIIGCVIFAVKFKKLYDNQEVDLHAGFALCIVAAVGAFVSAGLSAIGDRQT